MDRRPAPGPRWTYPGPAIGSAPASDCPDLTALPASARTVVDQQRFGGLTAYDTRRQTYGAERRTISRAATQKKRSATSADRTAMKLDG